jgi:hypothetical protein
MRMLRRATYLWPGLPQLWFRGAWSGLALALAFGALVNLLLVSSLIWTELLDPQMLRLGWTLLAVVWIGFVAILSWKDREQSVKVARRESQGDLYRQAMAEYLKGNWFDAETLLVQLIGEDPRDIDTRLMLATLMRHNKRYSEARRQLVELEKLISAEKWRFEIEQEKQLLAEVEADLADPHKMMMAAARRAA